MPFPEQPCFEVTNFVTLLGEAHEAGHPITVRMSMLAVDGVVRFGMSKPKDGQPKPPGFGTIPIEVTMNLNGDVSVMPDDEIYDGPLVFAAPVGNKDNPLLQHPFVDTETVRSLHYEHDPVRGEAARWRYTGAGVLAPLHGKDALQVVTVTIAHYALAKYENTKKASQPAPIAA